MLPKRTGANWQKDRTWVQLAPWAASVLRGHLASSLWPVLGAPGLSPGHGGHMTGCYSMAGSAGRYTAL